jgi:chromosome segregation ATPase
MNAKVCMIREALKLTGLDVDLWTIESPDQLAAMLASDNQAQEAELAETCAELSATNSSLKTTLTAQTTELAALKIELTNSAARHHADFTSWQSTLAKVTTELKTTQRDSPSRDLQNKITALQLRLKLSQDDNAILTTAKSLAENKVADLKHALKLRRDEIKILENEKSDAEHEAEVLTMHVTDQAERLRVSRGCIDRCVQINNELREEVEGQGQQIGDLTGMLEEARAAWREENEEVQRLTWLVGGREEEVRVLEGVREGLEKRLLLGEEEFVEVSEGDVPAATAAVVGNVDEGKDGSIVVQGEEKDCSADEFEEVDVDEESVGDEFEEVEVIEGVEVDESV